MLRLRFMFLAVPVMLLFTLPCRAGVIWRGPYRDYIGVVYRTSYTTLPTEFTATFNIPFFGTVHIGITDLIAVEVTKMVPIYVPSYVRVKVVGDPVIEDPLSFYDIYAKDMDPGNPGTSLTGFDPVDPELIPLSDETFIGISGTHYPAPVQTVLLGNLSSLMPDIDLSAFATGDPASIVYLAGPGDLPFADVPEPATLALLGLGGLAVIRRRSKRS